MKSMILIVHSIILLAVVLAAEVSNADDYRYSRGYPRVYGATHRLYGPTQAEYQYQRQYGRPSIYYGGHSPVPYHGYVSNHIPSYHFSNLNYGYSNYGFVSANYYPYAGFHPTGRFSTYVPSVGFSGFGYYPGSHYHSYYAPYRYGYPLGYGVNRYLPVSPFYGANLYGGGFHYASPHCITNRYNIYDLNNLGINYPTIQQSYVQQSYSGTFNPPTIQRNVDYRIVAPQIIRPVPDPVVFDVLRQHDLGRLEATQNKPVEVVVRKFATKSTTEAKIQSLNYQSQGDTSLREGQYEKAIRKYEIAQAVAGDRPEPYFRQAIAQIGQREYASALQSVRNGLELDPQGLNHGDYLTGIFGQQQNDALRMLTSQLADWVQQNPSDKSRLELQGVMLLMEGNQELAQKYFSVAKQLGGMQGTLASLNNLPAFASPTNNATVSISTPSEVTKPTTEAQNQQALGSFPALGNEVYISEPVMPPAPVTGSQSTVQYPSETPMTTEFPRFPAGSESLPPMGDSPLTEPPQ